MGLAGEITNNVTRGLQNVGQSFTNHLAGFIDCHKSTGGIPGSGVPLIGNLPNIGIVLCQLRSICY